MDANQYEYVERPPVLKPFDKMTKKEAKLFFQWHMDYLYKRINNMCQVLHFEPDYSEESLITLWDTVIQQYELVKKESITKELFTSVVNCCSLYLGEVFIKNNEGLYWNCSTSKVSYYNTPVIAGFLGQKNPLSFEPMDMVLRQETRIFRGEADKKDLYNLYKTWEQYCPQRRQLLSNNTSIYSELFAKKEAKTEFVLDAQCVNAFQGDGSDFIIVILDRSLKSSHGILETDFYVQCGGVAFPNENWIGVAASIINQWAEAVVSHYNVKRRVNYLLYFFGDDYELYVHQKNGEMDIEGVQNRHLIKFQYHCTSRFFLEKLWYVFCQLETIIQTNDKCRSDRESYQKSIDNYKEKILRCVKESRDGSVDNRI
jgi:hypothetical protein